MTMKVAVFGATGAQGGAVVREAIAQKMQVRAIARSQHRIEEQFSDSVEPFPADLLDGESLKPALKGVDAAFAHLPIPSDPTHPQRFLENLIGAALHCQLPLLVFTTSGLTGDRYPQVPIVAGATGARDALLNSGLPVVILQPTLYLENLRVPLFVPRLYEQGVLDYPPVSRTLQVGWISHTDQAKYAVASFEKRELMGRAYEILSPGCLTGAELAQALSPWLSREVVFDPDTPEGFGKRIGAILNPGIGAALTSLYQTIAQLPDRGFDDIDVQALQETFGVQLETVAEQIQQWPSVQSSER